MITLQNPGLLEIDFIKTMGVNVKDDENSIGKFGTGLKYAIAVFLRKGINFDLYIGNNKFDFYTETKCLRGKEFEYCYMQGPSDTTELPFTTEYGLNWDLWQAYREIHSNCLDEGGEIVRDYLSPSEDTTTFIFPDIDNQIDISTIFLNWEDDKKLVYSNDDIDIYEGESSYIFYQGIRAKNLWGTPSLYTYNIKKNCYLTEDRLLCYDGDVKQIINSAVISICSHNKDVFTNIAMCKSDNFESTLSMEYNSNVTPTEDFNKVIEEFKESKNYNDLNYGVRGYYEKHAPKPEPTREEEREEFISYLEDLCNDYGVNLDRREVMGQLVFELTGGILEVDKDD